MTQCGSARAGNGTFDNGQEKGATAMANCGPTGLSEARPRTGRGVGVGTRQQENFRTGSIEALLAAKLDRLKQATAEFLRGDADELSAAVDELKRLVSEYMRDDAETLTPELDRLKRTLSECLRGDAEKLTAEVTRLKQLFLECVCGNPEEEIVP
jgi:hypothetical protein